MSDSGRHLYKEEPYRFFNTIVFCLSGLANSFIVQALSPISVEVQQYCSASELEVGMCALVFMIVHPFMTFVANYTLNRWGLKLGVRLVITVGKHQLRIGSCRIGTTVPREGEIHFVLLGNAVMAFGNVFILNSPSQFSAAWFRPEIRLVVTSLAVFAMSVSGGAGALISPFIVKAGMGQEEGLQAVFRLMVVQGGPVAVIMIINLLFFRGKPKHPPAQVLCYLSPSGDRPRQDFLPSLKGLANNRNYRLLFLSMMCTLGTANSYSVTIEDFLKPFGMSGVQAALGLALTVVTGLIGSVLSSLYSTLKHYIVKKTKAYLRMIKVEMIVGIACVAVVALPLLWGVLPLYWIVVCLLGFSIYPIIPAIIELGCEVVFPIGEPISTGFLLAGGQLFAFVIGVIQTNVIKGETKAQSLIGSAIYTGVFATGLVVFMFVKQDLRRIDYEKNNMESSLLLSEESAQDKNVQ